MAINFWPFMNKNKLISNEDNQINIIPNHVAIIMDGNGRWAKQRGLPRIAGHKQGMDNVKRIVEVANAYQIKVLTLYAFSTENWKRPDQEVKYLMKLPQEFLNVYLPDLIKENVKIEMIGQMDQLPPHTKEAITKAIDKTKHNTGLILNIAMNYGSRSEIVNMVKSIAEDVHMNQLDPSQIDEQLVNNYLYTSHLPDPDLLIRTSGEIRLSNFLLWQLAYTEFWFTDAYWPAFSEKEFVEALKAFQKRKRRYGGLE
ncbi:isoprenyl transferase [Amphibacillus xylanus]|uniref:Isoprenyl transferase n=1 Tax=Amphibacillus xylanus (strain ATCC 51415 / DSM 6626 / JCM 7361 / LMG 17667 / NBRC 15112 / Ep01) TaxID=698758 RepID=K0IYQ9_AMPXN|nr:isoprenyl transferase [Amphibacillus xylanus]BAM47599.1 undecaprenyl pyrophosphate synthase [Amphibacillus xylanus NBRC 15112]